MYYGNHGLGIGTGARTGTQSVNLDGSNNALINSELAFGAGTGVFDRSANNHIENNVIAGNPLQIHHNWFHDTYARKGVYDHHKAAAVYLDNDASDIQVYRNVIWNIGWTAVQQNWNSTNNDIFNNTMWNIDRGVMGAWHKDGTSFSNIRVWNNLSNDDQWEPQADKQNNLTMADDPFVDSANGDFRLESSTQPVDFGRTIDGYTDGFSGSAPDVGAYEMGDDWMPGADWTP